MTSFDDPGLASALAPYRNQRDAWLRAAHNPDRLGGDDGPPDHLSAAGLFMVEGVGLLEHLLASPFACESLLLTPGVLDRLERDHADVLADLPAGVPIHLADPEVMDQITGFKIHRGLLCAARRNPPRSPEQVLAEAEVLVWMEDLANHDNVGGVFRSLAALAGLDAAGVLCTRRTCDPLYRKSLRVSMGQAVRVPFANAETSDAGFDRVRRAGYPIIALTPAPDAIDLADAATQLATAPGLVLLVGAEAPGLRPRTIERADLAVRIPIDPRVDSLNVSVAASIALARFMEARSRGDHA